MLISDRLGRLHLPKRPQRIVSLVPSWTEYLADIGDSGLLVGRTSYCISPDEILSVEEIGGTKNPDIGRIVDLTPDIVIANKEENKQTDINNLRASGVNVFVTAAITISEALEEMKQIEHIIDNNSGLYSSIYSQVQSLTTTKNLYSFVYLVWKEPYMAASKSTYISNLISAAGGSNQVELNWENRYPTIDEDDLVEMNLDVIFLPDEPYMFTLADQVELRDKLPDTKIILVDGTLASWYGKRMVEGLEYFSCPLTS